MSLRSLACGAAVFVASLSCAIGAAHADGGSAPPPSASASDEAGTRFRRGVELFKEADFRAALIEFRRAYQLAPNFRVLYNLGQSYLELQDYAGALRSFERYLEGGGSQVPGARRAAVEAEIAKLVPRVARVEITTNVPGAEIRVDDDVVGTSPLPPVLVSAGRRRFTVEKGAAQVATRTLDVAGGDRLTVSLPLAGPAPDPAPPPPVTVSPSAPPARASRANESLRDADAPSRAPARAIPWLGWGATAALAAGSAVTGLLALHAKDDLTQKQNTFPGSATELHDAQTKLRSFAITTDVLAGAAVVAGVTSLYFTLSRGSSASPRPAAAARVAPTPGVAVGVGLGHLRLEGRF